MFNPRELQTVISGALTPIDLQDLRRNTNYAGGYSDDHAVINTFWKVVNEFDENQKRKLLKFVTSCSRPPLLGKNIFGILFVTFLISQYLQVLKIYILLFAFKMRERNPIGCRQLQLV